MFIRSLCAFALFLGVGITQCAHAGFYSTIDNRQHEMLYSPDYRVFKLVMDDLFSISMANPERNPPIRRRYMLVEALAPSDLPTLNTLEQKLNYSAALIRRGKAMEATRFLSGVYDEDRKNFVVLSHYASALFLSKEPDRKAQAPLFMKKALSNWPKTWADATEEQKKMLSALAWDEFDFERFRRCEEAFERLIVNRLREKKLLDQKKPIEETVDPVFVDGKGQPLRLVNDKGDFAAGEVSLSAKGELPRDAVEVVEQLLMWMPGDPRLLWLLGEVFNATAMSESDKGRKDQRMTSAFQIYLQLTELKTGAEFGKKEIKAQYDVLDAYMASIKDPNLVPSDPEVPPSPWWRIGGGFLTGIAVGMFALWQLQEVRRRMQTRAAKA